MGVDRAGGGAAVGEREMRRAERTVLLEDRGDEVRASAPLPERGQKSKAYKSS